MSNRQTIFSAIKKLLTSTIAISAVVLCQSAQSQIVTFNQPNTPDGASSITKLILASINASTPNSEVLGSFMNWYEPSGSVESSMHLTKSIKHMAESRNLYTCFVTGDIDPHPSETMPDLPFLRKNGGIARIGPVHRVRNHSKFMVFSNLNWSQLPSSGLTGQTPALLVGSSNIGESSKNNTMLLIPLTTSAYQQIKSYFLKLKDAANHPQASPENDNFASVDLSNASILNLYPRRRLGNSQASANDHPYRTIFKDRITSPKYIQIVTPRFHNLPTAQALAKLLQTYPSLKVEVISRDGKLNGDPEISIAVRNTLRPFQNRCTLRVANSGVNIHSKYLLYKGKYRPSKTAPFKRKEFSLEWHHEPN